MTKQKNLADDDIVGILASNDISGSEDDFTDSDDNLVLHWALGEAAPLPQGGIGDKI